MSPFRRSRKQDPEEEPLEGDDSPEGRKLKRKFLERLRGRIDRYRELGKQRRERLEDKIQRREGRGDTPPETAYPSSYEAVPGTSRPVLSGADYLELEGLIV